MLEYETICYLQNQKTGCTFVEAFLRRFCTEPLLAYDKHAMLKRRSLGKLHFINVREPLAAYRSLFAYGLEGRGLLVSRLRGIGAGEFYDAGAAGFPAWLRFVLDPLNAEFQDRAYRPEVARRVGFMTWRFLRLACFRFEVEAPRLNDAAAFGAYVRANMVADHVLRNESLRDELARLVSGPIAHCIGDPDAALAWIAETPDINASQFAAEVEAVEVGADLRRLLHQREAFIYRNFYPQALDRAA